MTRAREGIYGNWSAEGLTLAIEYSLAALENIRAAVVDGFYKIPHGGIEVGGVLYGRVDGAVVRIEAFRPLACEHAAGPSFVLSERDRAALSALLEAARADGELAGMVPVGWYHSRTRSEIHLSAEDLEIYGRFFPEPWQVCLVLRPDRMKPVRAGFFAREQDGSVRASSSYREFTLEPARRKSAVTATSQAIVPGAGPVAASPWRTWVLIALALVLAFVAGVLAGRHYWGR